MRLPLQYGAIACIPREVQRIGDERRGIFVGVNDRDEYIVLTRDFKKRLRVIVGKDCTLYQRRSEDNCALEPEFHIESHREGYLPENERVFAEQFMSRRGL